MDILLSPGSVGNNAPEQETGPLLKLEVLSGAISLLPGEREDSNSLVYLRGRGRF